MVPPAERHYPIAAAAKNGPPAALSWAAGRDRCHEGGIILSKKPPELHLSLPLHMA